MAVHLLKLCVGAQSIAQLAQWQEHHLRMMAQLGQSPEIMHVTRQTPKRAEELLHGGSMYWVIKSAIVARQRLLELRPLEIDGVAHCGLVLNPEIITVASRPRRPFQGWRYLDPADVPPDIGVWNGAEDGASALQQELMSLGLV